MYILRVVVWYGNRNDSFGSMLNETHYQSSHRHLSICKSANWHKKAHEFGTIHLLGPKLLFAQMTMMGSIEHAFASNNLIGRASARMIASDSPKTQHL